MEILNKATIGVFGGSGFYSFLKDIEEIKLIHHTVRQVTVYF